MKNLPISPLVVVRRWTVAVLALVSLMPAAAQETISYSYDVHGHLVKVSHGTTGPNANVVSNYTYDAAENRCAVNVTTSGSGSAVNCPASTVTLTLTPSALPSGTVGSAYSEQITATGGTSPYSYLKTSGTLPAGLTLNTTTGVLSGTPTTATTYTFTVGATDSGGNSGSQTYTIVIGGGAVTLGIIPTTLPNGTVGAPYSQQITASGGTAPYTYWASGTLPAGLNLSSSTGLLSGTPSAANTYSFTVTATDAGNNTGSRPYSVTIGSGSTLVANSYGTNVSACGSVNVNVVTQVGDYDKDGDAITVSGVTNVSLGSATYSGTVISYSTFTSRGTGSLTYTISDGHGDTASNTITFNISGGVCSAPAM